MILLMKELTISFNGYFAKNNFLSSNLPSNNDNSQSILEKYFANSLYITFFNIKFIFL